MVMALFLLFALFLSSCRDFFPLQLVSYNNSLFCCDFYMSDLIGHILLASNQIGLCHLVRQAREDSDSDYYRDSSSDGSSDYEIDKGIKTTREQHSWRHLRSEIPIRLDRLSINDEHSARQEGFSSDDSEAGNSQGLLLFEFLEQDLPYCREPLADKVRYFLHTVFFCSLWSEPCILDLLLWYRY